MGLQHFRYPFGAGALGFLVKAYRPALQTRKNFPAGVNLERINGIIDDADKKVIALQPLLHLFTIGANVEIIETTADSPRDPGVVLISGVPRQSTVEVLHLVLMCPAHFRTKYTRSSAILMPIVSKC